MRGKFSGRIKTLSRNFIPKKQLKTARHFNAGSFEKHRVPQGRLK
jgi:hypothetical protein